MDKKKQGTKKNRTKIEVMDKKIVNKNWKKDKKKFNLEKRVKNKKWTKISKSGRK